FHINLATAKSVINPNADIGLRFSCFFRKDLIVRNARINGIWGEEEIHDIEGHSLQNPIEMGEFFVIYILACEEKFHISINNRPFCTFKYRLPLKSLRTIEICEQIQVIKQMDHRAVF
ncbi:32 kDa beta-galactoside-binding lectin lec-3-like, partial [Rhagoletis pomonella]|uniref:32 kDa beta-galactoside-binding lectin lec-3-like n=1 Tax=Rhagoletis pomonella TaxID=28610 RepID=UPI00177EE15A